MNYSNVVKEISESQLRTDLPKFNSGDTIRVTVKIKEDKKFRIQAFEGVVIKTQGSGITESVTIRKNSNGVFVERTLPIHSPIIDTVEVIKRGKVRRARIYYIRNLSGKAARIQERLPQRANPNAEEKVAKAKSEAKSITSQKALAAHQRRKRKAVDKKIANRINPDKIENKKIQAAKLEAKAKIAKKPAKPATAKKTVAKPAAKKPAVKSTTAAKPAAKKPAAKSAPAASTAAKKPAVKSTPAASTAAKKSAVKKATGAKKTQGK
ncbi:50S ribosomal protein L19 [Spiroplasma sp. TIUS-1]|nr:50S ribosomal protein L19 [Spiroplasma sp. TIUS-1]